MSKFNRTNFLSKETVTPGYECDMTSNDFSKYDIQFPTYTYTIKSADAGRPDRISIKIYGRQDYWWYLMKFNAIDDVWNELYPGFTLRIPDVRDINAYADKYSKQ